MGLVGERRGFWEALVRHPSQGKGCREDLEEIGWHKRQRDAGVGMVNDETDIREDLLMTATEKKVVELLEGGKAQI
jgi:hypothetical protein